MNLLYQEQEALKTKAATLLLRQKEYEQREKDLAQKQKHRRLLRLELMNIIESFPFLLLVIFVCLSFGTILGINFPNGVACSDSNWMCQKFRFKQPKIDYKG